MIITPWCKLHVLTAVLGYSIELDVIARLTRWSYCISIELINVLHAWSVGLEG